MQKIKAVIEIDDRRGVLYVHNASGSTMLRI